MNRVAVVLPLVLLVCILGAAGQAMLKQALNCLPPDLGGLGAVLTLLRTGRFYAGLLTAGCGTLLWLYVLSRAELSYALPFAGLGVLVGLIASVVVLKETVSPLRLAGTLVIVAGVAMVAKS